MQLEFKKYYDMKKTLLLICALAFLFACTNSKKVIYKEDESQIFFGSKGGFTNSSMEYVINGDRNVFKIKKDSTIFVSKISKQTFNEIEKLITDYNFKSIELDKPGNMTYHITVKNKDFENTVRWSGPEDKEINDLYNKLINTLKTAK